MAEQDDKPRWSFWLPDEDRSAGWTNHCYVLQFVVSGIGDTPEEAWGNLREPVPEDFCLPASLVATRDVDERHFPADRRPDEDAG